MRQDSDEIISYNPDRVTLRAEEVAGDDYSAQLPHQFVEFVRIRPDSSTCGELPPELIGDPMLLSVGMSETVMNLKRRIASRLELSSDQVRSKPPPATLDRLPCSSLFTSLGWELL